MQFSVAQLHFAMMHNKAVSLLFLQFGLCLNILIYFRALRRIVETQKKSIKNSNFEKITAFSAQKYIDAKIKRKMRIEVFFILYTVWNTYN